MCDQKISLRGLDALHFRIRAITSLFPNELWVNPKRFNDTIQCGLASNSLLLPLSYRSLQSRLCRGSAQTSWNLSCISNTVNTTKQAGVKNAFAMTTEICAPLGVSAWTGKQPFTEWRNSCTSYFPPICENAMPLPVESCVVQAILLIIMRNFFCHHVNCRTQKLKRNPK